MAIIGGQAYTNAEVICEYADEFVNFIALVDGWFHNKYQRKPDST